MKVVVAIDSLKGSLTSLEAGEAIQEGILRAISDAEVIVRPLADGGEGTVEALTRGMNGRYEKITVTDPLGRPTDAVYGILEDLHTAIIEMSAAAGITLIDAKDRNPMNTTTYGVGEMIKDAIGKGCRHFFIGIGGSATNDGGIGMLQALGYGMLDTEGKQVSLGAKGLAELVSITDENVLPELKECTFQIACDVKNPLCGELGCSAIFGPQKGATPDMITQMDSWLGKYALLTANCYKKADSNYPGTGAAGGMGFAFLSYMNAELRSGVQIVLEETKLEEYIRNADIVVTGEGCLDGQSVMGKAPIGVAALAKKHHKKVIAFAGCVTEDAKVCNQNGIDAFFPILRNVVTREEAMDTDNAHRNMTDTAEQVFRLIKEIMNEA
ncbi:putative uncharacterized protein [Roseburia sp. CAG:100]|nr:putative uncharacterized protein [Roseburia sp. CAG:100]HCI25350.1 glycerate kinase [Lachnospiraceae bacterium]